MVADVRLEMVFDAIGFRCSDDLDVRLHRMDRIAMMLAAAIYAIEVKTDPPPNERVRR